MLVSGTHQLSVVLLETFVVVPVTEGKLFHVPNSALAALVTGMRRRFSALRRKGGSMPVFSVS